MCNCNPEAIELLYEVFGFVYDLFNVLDDKVINKKLEVVQKQFIENIKFAQSLLGKKCNTKSLENTKKPKASKKQPAKK